MSLTKLPFDIVWGCHIHHSSKSMKCLRITWLKRGTTCSKFGEYTTKSGTYLIGSSSRLPAALPPENYTTIISNPWSLVFFQVLNHLTMPCLFWNPQPLGRPCDPFDVCWPLRPTRILLKTLHLAAVSCLFTNKDLGNMIWSRATWLNDRWCFSSCVTPGICKFCT